MFSKIELGTLRTEIIKDRLSSSKKLSEVIKDMNEGELLEALFVEVNSSKRMNIIYRLKSRYNKLRNQRENDEILKSIK